MKSTTTTTTNNETLLSDQSFKPRRPKTREVSSRFLSPSTSSLDNGIPSPNQALSPPRRQSTSTDPRKHRSVEGLWPSSATTSSSSKKLGTLADHLGNERLKDYLDSKKDKKLSLDNAFSLSRQRSCTELSRFENEKESAKENHRPFLGGSMRHTGKLRFPGKSSSSSSSSSNYSLNNSGTVPGRLSVDENALYGKSSRRKSDSFTDNLDSDSECSDILSGTDFSTPAIGKDVTSSTRKTGIEVSSKYLHGVPTRLRRGTSDSNIQHPVSLDGTPKMHRFTIKSAIKRANSLTGYGSASSQWALSPGRSGSPPMSVENKARPISFSTLKPPTSPSRVKGVEKLLNMGLDLFKSKKSSSGAVRSSDLETVHKLRLLHNRLMQWRYANARADTVKGNITNQAERNLLCAWDSLTKLRHSVMYKKSQLQKEKIDMKLDFILFSQMKPLETWGDMERQHLSAVSETKQCMHSVVCRVPLTEGAKVDPQSASIALRQASDLTSSIKSMLTTLSPSAENTVSLLSELAEVVAQEKLQLEEGLELLRTISTLEIQERSLKCYLIQLQLWQQQQQQQQQQS